MFYKFVNEGYLAKTNIKILPKNITVFRRNVLEKLCYGVANGEKPCRLFDLNNCHQCLFWTVTDYSVDLDE